MRRELNLSSPLNPILAQFLNPWTTPFDALVEDKNWSGIGPRCEITESESAYFLKIDLPGIDKDDIDIDLHESRLTVSGERRQDELTKTQKSHLSELRYGSFSRSFTFPTPVDSEHVHARFENGILFIEINKESSKISRKISIK